MSGLALFGGTFDPIHNAHLEIARAAADLCSLERILFVPSGNPPHRSEGPFAPFEDRYAMVVLACQCDSRFEPSRLEAAESKSYSIDTIEKIQAIQPGPLHFVIGADAFAEIQTWRRWEAVVAAVTFIVVSRPGSGYRIPSAARVVRLEKIDLAISSSQIRQQIGSGFSRVAVPAPVSAYIAQHCLYQSPKRD